MRKREDSAGAKHVIERRNTFPCLLRFGTTGGYSCDRATLGLVVAQEVRDAVLCLFFFKMNNETLKVARSCEVHLAAAKLSPVHLLLSFCLPLLKFEELS